MRAMTKLVLTMTLVACGAESEPEVGTTAPPPSPDGGPEMVSDAPEGATVEVAPTKAPSTPWVGLDALPAITPVRVASYVIAGGCSEEGEPVAVTIGNTLQAEASCEDGRFALTLDLTGLSHLPGLVAFVAEHADAAGEEAPIAWRRAENRFLCPEGFVGVPGLYGYEQSFCIAKFEMKLDDSSALASTPEGKPYTNVTAPEARLACAGAGYTLVTNDEWQTLARQLERTADNWAEGVVGSAGGMNVGHSDAMPLGLLAASEDDLDACAGTGQSCDGDTWSPQRRTHRLPNGELVWDVAGNAWELTVDRYEGDLGPSVFIAQLMEQTPPVEIAFNASAWRTLKGHFGPSGAYLSFGPPTWGGLGYAMFAPEGGDIARGGFYAGMSGVFAAMVSPMGAHPAIGFRCAHHP
ncbi:MAG: hypothetical protein KC731_32150 [Myxococcales bacterium]|nr:hypothetical protein [Myxococcales bacterium]